MLKQIKLMSVMSLVATCNLQAGFDLESVLNMGHTNAATLAAAVLLAEGAYCYSQREFDDKGTYRTIGGDEDSAISDLGYSCAYGTALTVGENIKDKVTATATWQDNAEKSIVNTLCFWITKQITRHESYKNLNRNSFLLRWVPITTKVDDGVKQLATFAIVKSLVGKALGKPAVVPAPAAN